MIAPYFALLVKEVGAEVNSLYRGEDAAAILHHYGKHTQAELYRELPPGTANPPGRSTHELRSDAVAYPGPLGRHLEWWQQGIDVNDSDVANMERAARRHGWELFQPYRAGVEFHHLNFRFRPKARGRDRLRIIALRRTLPRH